MNAYRVSIDMFDGKLTWKIDKNPQKTRILAKNVKILDYFVCDEHT